MSEQTILDEIETQIRRHSYFVAEEYYTIATLWPAGTYFVKRYKDIPLFRYFAMIGFMSVEPDSGKTRALDVVTKMSYNAIPLGNYTPAVCLSKVDRAVAEDPDAIITIPFDELDTQMGRGKDSSYLEMFFNEGYRAGSVISRCSRFQDKDKDTPAFCPKGFSALSEARIPRATMSRTFPFIMRPWSEDDPPVLNDVDYDALAKVSEHLSEWSVREDVTEALKNIDFGNDLEFLKNRNLEIFRSILAIAKITSPEWYQRALKAARFLTEEKQELATWAHKILRWTFREFGRNRHDLGYGKHKQMFHCGKLAEELFEEGLIPKWINGEKLGEFLKDYSNPSAPIHTRQVKIDGINKAGMDYYTLYPAWKTYLSPKKLITIMKDEGLSVEEIAATLKEIGVEQVGEVAEVAGFQGNRLAEGFSDEGRGLSPLPLPSLPLLPKDDAVAEVVQVAPSEEIDYRKAFTGWNN